MDKRLVDLYLVGLRNAHAVEAMATKMLERQIERIENYPEIVAVLQTHLAETNLQSERLESLLESQGSASSALKEGWMSLTGNAAALFHGVMEDEVMKNHFVNAAVEAYECAMYSSLITMAGHAGDRAAVPILSQSLAEEQKTERLIQEMTEALTVKYLTRAATNEKAGI